MNDDGFAFCTQRRNEAFERGLGKAREELASEDFSRRGRLGDADCVRAGIDLKRAELREPLGDLGEIRLDDTKLTHMPIHRRARLGLSYLPQENSVFRKLDVADNIRAVLELQHLSKDEIENRLDGLLQELHITHLRNAPAMPAMAHLLAMYMGSPT